MDNKEIITEAAKIMHFKDAATVYAGTKANEPAAKIQYFTNVLTRLEKGIAHAESWGLYELTDFDPGTRFVVDLIDFLEEQGFRVCRQTPKESGVTPLTITWMPVDQ